MTATELQTALEARGHRLTSSLAYLYDGFAEGILRCQDCLRGWSYLSLGPTDLPVTDVDPTTLPYCPHYCLNRPVLEMNLPAPTRLPPP